MSAKRNLTRIAAIALAAWLAIASQALAAPEKPAWQVSATALPTSFRPGTKEAEIFLYAANVGAAPTNAPFTLSDALPKGITPTFATVRINDPAAAEPSCGIEASTRTVSCTGAGPLNPGHHLEVRVGVEVDPLLAEGPLPNEATVSGGGALPASAQVTLLIEPGLVPFGILPGFSAPALQSDGATATLAGSHPYALDVSFGFPSERQPGGRPLSDGHVHTIFTDLPRGEIVNPTATALRCTNAQLVTDPGCPPASAMGTLTVTTVPVEAPEASTFPIFNMVPPPGQAAEIGANAFGVGIFVHIDGSVRSDGDYGITGASRDILARTVNLVFDVKAELWGDPSSPSHDTVRGACAFAVESPETCPVTKADTAQLTLPGDCPHAPLITEVKADSWEEPSPPAALKSARYEGLETEGCGALDFKPSIEAKPTTNLPDAPSGLDANVHQPQNFDLESRATAALKDITLTLPEGLVVNPAQAQGLGACTSAQIGLRSPIGQNPVRFSKDPAQCPDAAKIGSVQVSSPLLAEYDEAGTTAVIDPNTGQPKPRPLPGSLYLAKPFANPFKSLLAVYLSVNDPQSGVVAKFAGQVKADPVSGRLTTSFTETPELPLEDTRVHLFGGSRGALRTPPACGTYTTKANLVPWSSPEGLDVEAKDSFAINAGPCPAVAPHQPSFVAGTLEPTAGAYSPLTMKISREDASQPLAGFEATLPPGLSAKLAGVPYCTEAEIAAAKAREEPEKGVLEQLSPSCPAASEVGSLDVAAGSGPTPLHTAGHLYLAGPYKNAPLSIVAITPAVAGPFDLGTVVVRAALYLNPVTAQGHAVSDPLPQILDGIPLDVRSVALKVDRPQFTLNPTSCEPKTVLGTATSALGQVAALQSPFQVGGCKALTYKPKLHTRLFGPIHRGGHPRFRAVFEAKRGEANTGRIVFVLPPSEFIDQAHFRTICTRVQFAAKQCPAGSVYGHVKAITPLLGYPLEGPVYLRSSSHELPDAVVALRGPPSQPVEIELAGRVDSVNGGLRTTFESVPDAPVSKVVVTLQGAKKGLFQNSTNICKGIHRAKVKLTAQNAKVAQLNPLMKADCKGAKKKGKGARTHR